MDNTSIKKEKPLQMMKALFLSYALTGIALLVLAFLLYKMELGESQINTGIMIIYILSCLGGGLYIGKRSECRRFLWGMGLGVEYAALLNVVTFVAEHQRKADLKEMILMFFLCMIGGTLGGMLS